MSAVAIHQIHDDAHIFKQCRKKCGIVTMSLIDKEHLDKEQFFALGCLFCKQKFLYFDCFVKHIQQEHEADVNAFEKICDGDDDGPHKTNKGSIKKEEREVDESSVLIKEVKQEFPDDDEMDFQQQQVNIPPFLDDDGLSGFFVKPESHNDENMDDESQSIIDNIYETCRRIKNESNGSDSISYNDNDYSDEDNGLAHYDDMVEQSLIQDSNDIDEASTSSSDLALHIKDRKMIQFVIDQYRTHPNLWDHRHPHFRDRRKRQQFIDWMLMEFKRRYNIALARDAITRKWDNLRTVYKRECNRMSMEKTNISTLWYFKELSFLSHLYPTAEQAAEPAPPPPLVTHESISKRRTSSLWNDVSTSKLLTMLRKYPTFYDRSNPDYRCKEARGDALNDMTLELQKMVDITPVQISKRISQLRFDYSRQKQERLQCEQNNIAFVPTYSYYELMQFMDADIAPYKCDFCEAMLPTMRDYESHSVLHQGPNLKGFRCPICHACFPEIALYNRHKEEAHASSLSPPLPPTQPSPKLQSAQKPTNSATSSPKYHCDLCTASFREKSNYDEHMRRHNDDLFLPGLAEVDFVSSPTTLNPNKKTNTNDAMMNQQRVCICDICNKSFYNSNLLATHRAMHSSEKNFLCDFPDCGRAFPAQRDLVEHSQQKHFHRKYKCETCHKYFKSTKNLNNHRALHDSVKRFKCKVCGAPFAQAAGLYLHKRKYNHGYNPVRLQSNNSSSGSSGSSSRATHVNSLVNNNDPSVGMYFEPNRNDIEMQNAYVSNNYGY